MADDNLGNWSAEAKLETHDYFKRHLGGALSPEDAKLDPQLQKLLTKLYERQRDEAYRLLEETKAQMQAHDLRNNPNHIRQGGGCAPETLKQFTEFFRKDYDQQILAFGAERERHIREFLRARDMIADMEKQQRRDTLERGLDQDKPKLSR